MDRVPAAYIRRSFVDAESPGDISELAQLAAVKKLAAADGHNGNLQVFSDWGVSADVAKSAKRTEYTRLLADMEDGRILAVYAFDVDRLYRDPRDLIRLQDAAQRHTVTITTTGGRLAIGDGDDPTAEGFAFMGAVFGRMELQKSKKRARAAMAARRERGDRMGQPPYGYRTARDDAGRIIHVPDPEHPASVVVDAYREAGSIMGAAKLLQARGIPAPKGGHRWGQHTVTSVIEHNAPELRPRKGPSGRRTPAHAILAQLLRCHCGHVMTPNRARGQYYCPAGHRDGSEIHGKITATEAAILPFVRAEVARLRLPDAVTMAADNAVQRDALAGRLERAHEVYVAGAWTRERHAAEVAAVTAELDRLGDAETLVAIPAIDWTWAPRDVNAILRAILERVELGPDLRPVSAVWRNPELRR
jgi:DNA invertase Pin-like site-specific DNA recombinase